MATPKYFYTTTGIENYYPKPIQTAASQYCYGLAVGNNPFHDTAGQSSISLLYGTGAIKSLNHGRVFNAVDASITGIPVGGLTPAPSLPSWAKSEHNLWQTPDGSSVRPLFAKTKILIERPAINLNGTNPREMCPMLVRICQVEVKEVRNGSNGCNPSLDLFVDQVGKESGVSDGNWTKQELVHSEINTNKYKLLNDMSFTLAAPLAYCGPSVTSITTPEPNGLAWVGTGAQNFRELEFSHDLGEKLNYDPDHLPHAQSPKSGMNTSYIFMHSRYIGGDPMETTPLDSATVRTKSG